MTCIVGLVHEGVVYMGGDSAATSSAYLNQTILATEKVFRNGAFLIGAAGSERASLLLRHSLIPPRMYPDEDIDKQITVDFVNAIRSCLKSGGVAWKRDEFEWFDGSFLLGYRGHLFAIGPRYGVSRPLNGVAATGTGEDFALGVLYATQGRDPRERLLMALTAAEEFNAGVRGPFHILPETDPEPPSPPPPLEQERRRRVM